VFVLFIPAFFIFSANGILSVLATVFLANSVDYGELVNNRRDESVIFSMQTFVVKLASGIAAFAASVCLSVNNLKSEEITEAEKSIDFSLQTDSVSRLGLRMTMTVIPVIGLFIALFYFKKKFILDEKKMEEITAELGRKHAEDK
ncbi:MAG: MFS transporter, partial [Lachnospiraceae bacterium]|nr:MFS transporter [Lachnospiraceae bacterium]